MWLHLQNQLYIHVYFSHQPLPTHRDVGLAEAQKSWHQVALTLSIDVPLVNLVDSRFPQQSTTHLDTHYTFKATTASRYLTTHSPQPQDSYRLHHSECVKLYASPLSDTLVSKKFCTRLCLHSFYPTSKFFMILVD